jgi:hypothetical protein
MADQPRGPGPGWKSAWRDPRTGDDVSFHEDDALASIDLSKRCESHTDRGFCRRCLPRLEAAAAAARRCLDPDAPAEVKEAPEASDMPEMLALVNPIAKAAFAMRLAQPMRLSATKLLYTSKDERRLFDPVVLVKHVTESRVCEAIYMRAFWVRLGEGIPQAYTKRLWEARFSLSIDGDSMLDPTPLREVLGKREIPLPKPTAQQCLFPACAMDKEGNAQEDQCIGYMLPNGTNIIVKLDSIPGGGGGLVRIETGWNFGVYTTKERKSVYG